MTAIPQDCGPCVVMADQMATSVISCLSKLRHCLCLTSLQLYDKAGMRGLSLLLLYDLIQFISLALRPYGHVANHHSWTREYEPSGAPTLTHGCLLRESPGNIIRE